METAVVEPVHIPDKPIILESIPEIPENGVILALPNKDTSMQPPTIPVQLGGDIYVEQANQIASKELRNMLQQVSKVQKGSSTVGGTKKEPVQIARRHATVNAIVKAPSKVSSSNSNLSLAKGEERKKKEKGNKGKTTLAEFCADMGEDSPNPPRQ